VEILEEIQKPLEALIALLKERINLDLWMFTRVIEDDWIIIAASENNYGIKSGDVLVWSESICSRMVGHEGPNIAPDITTIDSYNNAPIARHKPIAAYVGFPILNENEELLGTLCAIDQKPRSETLTETNQFIQPLLNVAKTLINQNDTILRLHRALDKLNEQSSIDDITGLPNQEAFFQIAEETKHKYDALDCPIGVIVIDLGSFSLKRSDDGLQYEDLMRAVTADLSAMTRDADVLSKLYGNRFCMLLVNVDTKYVGSVVMKIAKNLERYKMNVSIGADVCRKGKEIQASISYANDNKIL